MYIGYQININIIFWEFFELIYYFLFNFQNQGF